MDLKEKTDLAISLALRAKAAIDQHVEWLKTGGYGRRTDLTDEQWSFEVAMGFVEKLHEHIIDSENPPDQDWYEDYFTLTGDHVVLTDEGWVPADMKGDNEALAELNAPVPS